MALEVIALSSKVSHQGRCICCAHQLSLLCLRCCCVWMKIMWNCLFVGILVTASQDKSNRYDYNIVSVVLLTEVLKLVISAVLYCRR